METKTLTLYHREGCHLCEQMVYALAPLSQELDFVVEPVDIDNDPALRQRFNEKIPVLMVGEDVVCCHFLDEKALRQALTDG
ncbi:glutaredoxin [Acidihalobacter aeolianus]|uniref:Glutaredoxin n=1 Tax=Acidihalobacter aeolianus TaxID=2792603 RepID=A0A1D8K8J1_9GAMM|nr:glutaredoxin family protein [Acidihalobacter aeolianus]AOV17267.1 glutaredoxin [Acidihalobacter aeolianus]